MSSTYKALTREEINTLLTKDGDLSVIAGRPTCHSLINLIIGGAPLKSAKILFLWLPLKIAGIVDIGAISREKKFRGKKSTGRSPICGFPAIFAFLPPF